MVKGQKGEVAYCQTEEQSLNGQWRLDDWRGGQGPMTHALVVGVATALMRELVTTDAVWLLQWRTPVPGEQ